MLYTLRQPFQFMIVHYRYPCPCGGTLRDFKASSRASSCLRLLVCKNSFTFTKQNALARDPTLLLRICLFSLRIPAILSICLDSSAKTSRIHLPYYLLIIFIVYINERLFTECLHERGIVYKPVESVYKFREQNLSTLFSAPFSRIV